MLPQPARFERKQRGRSASRFSRPIPSSQERARRRSMSLVGPKRAPARSRSMGAEAPLRSMSMTSEHRTATATPASSSSRKKTLRRAVSLHPSRSGLETPPRARSVDIRLPVRPKPTSAGSRKLLRKRSSVEEDNTAPRAVWLNSGAHHIMP